jgi:hypothetical protein
MSLSALPYDTSLANAEGIAAKSSSQMSGVNLSGGTRR